MVWLDMTGKNGNTLYFVTDRMERLADGGGTKFILCGILGDGCRESEVLVEVGDEPQVTFVDAWLANHKFRSFLANIDQEQVTAELLEVAARLIDEMNGPPSPIYRFRRNESGGHIAEPALDWRAVA